MRRQPLHWAINIASSFALATALVTTVTTSAIAQEEGGGNGDGEADTRPCRPQTDFVGSGRHEGKTFAGVYWTMIGGLIDYNTAKFRSQGNHAKGITVSMDRRWEWINAAAVFECNELYIPGPGWVQQYHAISTEGSVVPYGEPEEERSEVWLASGGSTEDQGDDEYYLCWFFIYEDGTRSDYFFCERIA